LSEAARNRGESEGESALTALTKKTFCGLVLSQRGEKGKQIGKKKKPRNRGSKKGWAARGGEARVRILQSPRKPAVITEKRGDRRKRKGPGRCKEPQPPLLFFKSALRTQEEDGGAGYRGERLRKIELDDA